MRERERERESKREGKRDSKKLGYRDTSYLKIVSSSDGVSLEKA